MNSTINIFTQPLAPSLFDYSIMGFYLILMFLWATIVKQRHIEDNPAYAYYRWALLTKIVGAIALCLVYVFHYGRQDTLGFYLSSEALANLFYENTSAYIKMLLGSRSPDVLDAFTPTTGYPWYRRDLQSFFVVRVTSIFTIIGFKNYFTTSILFAWFFFTGFWKLFLLLCDIKPQFTKQFFIAVFLVPSVMFWSSGILKDTISLSMMGWLLYSAYFAFVKKKKVFINIIGCVISTYFILSVKPYIIVALIPGLFIWIGWNYLKKIENKVLRFIVTPFTLATFVSVALFILGIFGEFLGFYGTLDGIITKAIITYDDHIRAEQYGENFYYLGEFDGTISDFFAKAPFALIAGLFRPFIWEARNIFMILAAIENLILLVVFTTIFWRTGVVKTITIILDDPLVIFSLSFAFVFAFAVGISTANFGALVRLKTPMLPLLVSGLYILYYRSLEIKQEKMQEQSKVMGSLSAGQL